MNTLLDYFLPDDAFNCLVANAQQQLVRKSTKLISANKENNYIYFIKEGLARSFYEIETFEGKKEITTLFFAENQIIFSIPTIMEQKPAKETVEMLEDSHIYFISYSKLEEICKVFPLIQALGMKMLEKQYQYVNERVELLTIPKAEKRYEVFQEKYPSLVQRIPLYLQASYLNILPSSLSRIRKPKRNCR